MHAELVIRKTRKADAHKLPLLCVHGGYHAAWCWNGHFLSFFVKAGFDAYALSLRGQGKSDGKENIWEMVAERITSWLKTSIL
jgi:hypothetical protein